jgi:hypothetical protein
MFLYYIHYVMSGMMTKRVQNVRNCNYDGGGMKKQGTPSTTGVSQYAFSAIRRFGGYCKCTV